MAADQPISEQYADEQWKTIPGWEGRYSVSDQGRVRSEDQNITTKAGVRKPHRGRALRPRLSCGRLSVSLGRNNSQLIHRLVMAAFVGPCSEGMEVCHQNGDPTDNRLVNLRYDDHSGNMNDRMLHGTDHQRNKTHCKRGHVLDWPNLVPSTWNRGRQWRGCLACQRAQGYIYTRPELKPHFQEVSDSYYETIMRDTQPPAA